MTPYEARHRGISLDDACRQVMHWHYNDAFPDYDDIRLDWSPLYRQGMWGKGVNFRDWQEDDFVFFESKFPNHHLWTIRVPTLYWTTGYWVGATIEDLDAMYTICGAFDTLKGILPDGATIEDRDLTPGVWAAGQWGAGNNTNNVIVTSNTGGAIVINSSGITIKNVTFSSSGTNRWTVI